MKKLFLILILFIASNAFSQPMGTTGNPVSDTAYNATTWDGKTTIAPSQNAIRDKLEAGVTGVGTNETYGSGWNADTAAPEKDDVYDYLHLLDTDDDGDIDTVNSTVTLDTEWDSLAEINAATTDADALDTTTAASTYAPIASPALTGDSTLTDATPTLTLQDSDNAAGTAGVNFNSSGGANDVVATVGVEDSTGASTPYQQWDGVTETVDFLKNVTLANGGVLRTSAITEGHTFAFQVYDNTANQWKPALTFTNGVTGAYKVSLGAGVTFDGLGSLSLGSVIMGDTTPDAEGEFGYASNQLSIHDGTASRSVLQVASTTITKSELIPIEWAEDGATAPAAAAQVGTTDLIARSFAEDADNDVIIYWQLPLDYSAGVKYRVYYALNANGVADETAAFALSGISVANSESLAGAMGTAVVVTDEIGENDDTSELLVSDWSAAVTIDGTPAAGELAKLTFIRDVSGDDVADHLLVAFIEIKYQAKVNASTDY